MWHFGLGAVSSVAGWIWHSGINARWHGIIYHSQHQLCCWISNGHVARTIPFRFYSSKRSCCICQSYYFWRRYTAYTHKYKRYVIQNLTQYQKKQCTKKTTIWIFAAVKFSELLNYLYYAFSIYQEIILIFFFNLDLKWFLQIFEIAFAVILGFENLHYKVSICNVVCVLQALYFTYSIMYTSVLFMCNINIVFYIFKF